MNFKLTPVPALHGLPPLCDEEDLEKLFHYVFKVLELSVAAVARLCSVDRSSVKRWQQTLKARHKNVLPLLEFVNGNRPPQAGEGGSMDLKSIGRLEGRCRGCGLPFWVRVDF